MRTEFIKLKLSYRNDKVLYGLISTIIGECDRLKGKSELTDDVIKSKVLKPMLTNNKKFMAMDISSEKMSQLETENKFLETYLSKGKLTDEELRDIISDLVIKDLPLSEVMKTLKIEYSGKYDGKLASQIAKDLINLRNEG